MHDIYVGIDNGISGACAALRPGTGELSAILMPTREVGKDTHIDDGALAAWLLDLYPDRSRIFVTYEQGQKQPKFGCKGNFAQGYSFGVIATLTSQLRLARMAVNPRDWQKTIFIGIRSAGDDTKTASVEFCRRTYPYFDLRPTPRSRNPHNGISDAICIATWSARQSL